MTKLDEIAESVKAVAVLKDTVAKHAKVIDTMADILEDIVARLDKLEKPAPGRKK